MRKVYHAEGVREHVQAQRDQAKHAHARYMAHLVDMLNRTDLPEATRADLQRQLEGKGRPHRDAIPAHHRDTR